LLTRLPQQNFSLLTRLSLEFLVTQKMSVVVRATSGLASAVLAFTGVSLVALPASAAPAASLAVAAALTPVTVYNSIPAVLPGSYPSLGFEATQTDEFGDQIELAAGPRVLTDVTVGFTNWSCESDYAMSAGSWTPAATGTPCVSTEGSSFTHPITLNVYEVDESAAVPTVGALITSVRRDVTVPFRPSADASCVTTTQWKDEAGNCRNGFAFNSTFTLTDTPVVSDNVIVTVEYNTNTSGNAKLAVEGPYDSLNVSINSPATVGTDPNPSQMFVDYGHAPFYSDAGAGGVDFLRADDDWATVPGMLLTVNATAAPAASIVDATVRQRDIKPVEDATTYQSWHEGKNNATPAYSVLGDGLHLGDGSASTIIKGTNIATSVTTEAGLRALIQSAQLTLVSGATTLQVPVHYRVDGVEKFTTLRSTALTGAGTKNFALADLWATTRVMGSYTATQEEDSLGALLNELFSISDTESVRLGGFGAQADAVAPAVVSSIVWDATRYNFSQPVTTACVATPGPASTNVASNGWTFGESGTTGHNVYTSAGLHVYTESNASTDKAAGYRALDIPLSAVGVPALDLTVISGGSPSIQLGIDLTGDGTWDGYLVNEGTIYGAGNWWTNKSTFGVTAGGGYPSLGTLDAYLVANPDARVTSFGYSLGSGVLGDSVIHSITVGCQTYGFTAATAAVALSDVNVTGYDIRPNESTYAGWHEGGTNALRAYSVRTDGLHLGDGNRASQILYGLPTPLATTTLESVVTATSIDVVSGSASLQVPLFYGPTQSFTTLRKESLSPGVHTVSVSDIWVTSRAIRNAAGTELIAAGAKVPLADLVKVLSAQGDVIVLGFAVQANSPTVVKSLTGGNVKYTFTPASAPTASPIWVPEASIAGKETAGNYSSWHEGYDNATPAFTVDGHKLKLGIGVHSQIIKGIANSSDSLEGFVAKAGVTVSSGSVTFQIPITFGVGSTFTTLRSDSITTGATTFDLNSQWRSSKSIGTITSGTLYALGDIVDALHVAGNVKVLAFGVQADAPASVTSVVWDGTKYKFLDVPAMERLAGADRYEAAVSISKAGFAAGEPNTVYLASGNGYADALSAAPAAAHQHAPLLLTGRDALPASIKAELLRLAPPKIVVAGGSASVSPAVIDELEALPFSPSVIRIGGADRFVVSRGIAEYAFADASTAYVATGMNFPDALAAGPAAAQFDAPVILINGAAASVDAATLNVLDDLGVTSVKIAGGEATVSPAIEAQLTSTFTTVKRNGGADRYAAAVSINGDAFASATTVYLATGEKFPDALTGAALAGNKGAPLFVSPGSCVPVSVINAIADLGATNVVLLGGRASLAVGIESFQAC
jgi:putative cell wall-binding protein